MDTPQVKEWSVFKRVPNARAIADGLKRIPTHWSLTPLQDKSPKRENWQVEDFIPHNEIKKLILSGEKKVSSKGNEYTAYASGFGLRTGDTSGGLLAIDIDGESAQPLLDAISGGDIPVTVSWTSGKAGRKQLLFQIPDNYRDPLKDFTRAVSTEWGNLKTARDEEGRPTELLEFRYNRAQSCLPPSRHPQTGKYKWINAPDESAVAEAPQWLCELLIKLASEDLKREQQRKERVIRAGEIKRGEVKTGSLTLTEFLQFEVLPRLSLDQIFNWPGHNFRQFGKTYKGNPPWRKSVSGTSFHVWDDGDQWAWQDKATSEGGSVLQYRHKLRGGTGSPKGKDFVEIVKELATEAGLEMPKQILKDLEVQEGSNKSKSDTSTNDHLSRKINVNVDNALLSTALSTDQMDNRQAIESIVINVNKILGSNFSDILECQELDSLYNQYKNIVARKLFDQVVASQRVKIDEISPEDEIKFKSLIDYGQAKIDWDEVLPAPLARDIRHDAEKLNVDPIVLWQAFLPAVSSLIGGFSLDEYGGVPPINWTCTVLASGKGKSRADSLVFAPLRSMQLKADNLYKEQFKEYKRAIAQFEKNPDPDAEEPVAPTLKKHIFDVATIQSVLKRLSEQKEPGSLWARDELKGLFASLNQFSGNENEGTELVLKLWDGTATFVDRVDISSSFAIPESAVSVTGGIQPAVFRKVFKDADDGNGMQARFLFAVPEERKKQYVPGAYCRLSDRLPVLYEWLYVQKGCTVKLSPEAQRYFAKMVDSIGDQIEQISHSGIRTWMNKLDTHILRISLALHAIECFYNPSGTDIKTLSLATLKRAVAFAQYYRSAFHVLQEKVSLSDDMASIMLKIHSASLNKYPDGISSREVCRGECARIIQQRAKAAGREPAAYVVDVFEKLTQMGYGSITRSGRSIKYVAFKKEIFEEGKGGADIVDNAIETVLKPLQDKEKECQQNLLTLANVNVDIDFSTESTDNAMSLITPDDEEVIHESDLVRETVKTSVVEVQCDRTTPRPASATVVYDPEHSQKIEQTIEDTVVMLSDPAILDDSEAIEYLEGEINKLHLEARAKLLQDDRIPNEVREFISAM